MKLLSDCIPDKLKLFLFEINLFTIKIDKVNVGLAILRFTVDKNNKYC